MVIPSAQPPTLVKKSKQDPGQIINMVGNEFAKFNRRVSLIENRFDGMQEHIDLIDSNLIEKHKASIKDIRDLQGEMRTLHSQLGDLSELLKRIAGKMSDFANRDDLKVIEKYMNYWSPMSFTTRNEVESMIQDYLEDKKEKVTKEDVASMVSEHVAKRTASQVTQKDVKQLVAISNKGITESGVKKIVKQHLSTTKPLARKDITDLIKAEVGKLKIKSTQSLSKKELSALVKEEMKLLRPKVGSSGLSEEEIRKITKGQIEDLFGKM